MAAEAPNPAAAGAADAEAYLLIDYQTNVATEESYIRVVKELTSAGGVALGSNLTAGYDPSYQRLLLHHIRVIRSGTASSRLSRQAVHLLRRELSLESQMLDGSLTASVVLEDVRPGDRIDFAFTVRGRNPALAGRYADAFTCGWQVPVARERVRILCPASRPLSYKLHGGTAEPARGLAYGLTEYVWEFAATLPVPAEDQSPSWHISAPWLQVSEFKDWAEVRRWAAGMYPPARLPPELERLAASWEDRGTAPLDRALAALDWVQQNIRYVGIELGTGSFVPSPPETVCERRFGDCKDQSYLLCTLLQHLGLQAEPVLVNTWARQLVADMLPSAFAFNHVVTRIRSGSRTYFVDPADSFQRGAIADRYMPNYGHGLPLGGEHVDLLAFRSHQGVAPEVEVFMRFVASDWEQPAVLEIESVMRGGAADNFRQMAATIRLEELASGYLNYYAARYPGIQPAGHLRLTDDPKTNVYRTTERYSLPGFWQAQSAPAGYRAEVFADAIIDTIPTPKTKVRLTPLAVAFPQHVVQRIEIELPEPWPGKPRNLKFTNAAFELSVHQINGDRRISLSYDYRTRAADIPAKEFAKYQRSLLDLDPELGFEMWSTESAVPANPDAPSAFPLALCVAGFALLATGAALAHRKVVLLGRALPAPEERMLGQPQGLGGWLILVGFGLFARPFLSIVSFARLAPMLSVSSWNDFTRPGGSNYHALWGTFILFDLLANLAMATAAVLLLVWFFQRRRAFPKAFIYLLIGQAVIALADLALARAVAGVGAEASSPTQAFGMTVSGALWIFYMLRSTRVQLTFTR